MKPLVLLVLVLVLCSTVTTAQVPRSMSYQGVLTDSTGTPKPDGSYALTVRVTVCVPEMLVTAGEMNSDTDPPPTAAELTVSVEVDERLDLPLTLVSWPYTAIVDPLE